MMECLLSVTPLYMHHHATVIRATGISLLHPLLQMDLSLFQAVIFVLLSTWKLDMVMMLSCMLISMVIASSDIHDISH
jgi:hypothetical protein